MARSPSKSGPPLRRPNVDSDDDLPLWPRAQPAGARPGAGIVDDNDDDLPLRPTPSSSSSSSSSYHQKRRPAVFEGISDDDIPLRPVRQFVLSKASRERKAAASAASAASAAASAFGDSDSDSDSDDDGVMAPVARTVAEEKEEGRRLLQQLADSLGKEDLAHLLLEVRRLAGRTVALPDEGELVVPSRITHMRRVPIKDMRDTVRLHLVPADLGGLEKLRRRVAESVAERQRADEDTAARREKSLSVRARQLIEVVDRVQRTMSGWTSVWARRPAVIPVQLVWCSGVRVRHETNGSGPGYDHKVPVYSERTIQARVLQWPTFTAPGPIEVFQAVKSHMVRGALTAAKGLRLPAPGPLALRLEPLEEHRGAYTVLVPNPAGHGGGFGDSRLEERRDFVVRVAPYTFTLNTASPYERDLGWMETVLVRSSIYKGDSAVLSLRVDLSALLPAAGAGR